MLSASRVHIRKVISAKFYCVTISLDKEEADGSPTSDDVDTTKAAVLKFFRRSLALGHFSRAKCKEVLISRKMVAKNEYLRMLGYSFLFLRCSKTMNQSDAKRTQKMTENFSKFCTLNGRGSKGTS